VFGGERSCDASVTKFDLVIPNTKTSRTTFLLHVLLTHLSYQLHLLGQRNSQVISYIFYLLLELNLFIFALVLFLNNFANVGGTDHSNSHIGISQPPDIICTVSSIYNTSLGVFEILDDDLFVMRRCSCKD